MLEILGDERPLMSWINLGEVAYLEERRLGRDRAGEVVDLRVIDVR